MLTPHPGASVSGEVNTAAPVDDRYKLRVLTRIRVAGLGLRPGATLMISPDKLRVAAHLVKTGAARPLDERTRLDVSLHLALDEVLPR